VKSTGNGDVIMPCTTVLAGKLATNDRSTMIARTDDGHFDEKKLIVVEPDQQPKIYKSVESHVEITLPENPMRYTSCPSVDPKHGIWAATGINAANVGMTATETTTSNPRVLAADPMVELREAKDGEEERCGGIGEEDIVVLVLPYIRSAREGVLRLGALLEQYGTYESNGIAFNDENEVWWLETIGGHHWIAKKIPEDRVIINPNQFGMDSFDLEDAFGARESHLCSADLREFISENHLDLNQDGEFNPRDIFGSHRDMDHIYNTPRAWFMGRCLAPHTYRWDGENADFTPESDDIPWSYVPERKVAAEDIQYLLSSHYQGTPYDPYAGHAEKGGIYRPIGINRTGVTTICQIRSDVPDAIKGIEWVCFGSTTFSAWLPVYTNVPQMPDYLSNVTLDAETDNLYWVSRFVGALADKCYGSCIQNVWGYQDTVNIRGRQIVLKYDRLMRESGDFTLAAQANDELCAMAKEESTQILNKVLRTASEQMKNGFSFADTPRKKKTKSGAPPRGGGGPRFFVILFQFDPAKTRKDDNHGRKKNRKALAGRADAARRHRRYHRGASCDEAQQPHRAGARRRHHVPDGVVLRHPVCRAAAGHQGDGLVNDRGHFDPAGGWRARRHVDGERHGASHDLLRHEGVDAGAVSAGRLHPLHADVHHGGHVVGHARDGRRRLHGRCTGSRCAAARGRGRGLHRRVLR